MVQRQIVRSYPKATPARIGVLEMSHGCCVSRDQQWVKRLDDANLQCTKAALGTAPVLFEKFALLG